MKTGRVNEASHFEPKEQVGEDDEASTATETVAEDETSASTDREHAINRDQATEKVFFYKIWFQQNSMSYLLQWPNLIIACTCH